MKKLFVIPFMMMFLLSIFGSFVSAGLQVTSSSPVQFTSSDSEFGTAYLIGAVENGGSDKIMFSNLPVSSGYLMKNTQGYITGTPSNVYASYPYTGNRELWTMDIYNNGASKWFLLGFGDAQSWCSGLTNGQGIAAAKGMLGTGSYYCFAPRLVGVVGDVGGAEYKWTETFTVYNSLTSSTQSIVLSDQSLAGNAVYTPDKQAVVKYSFSGLNTNSYIPDLSSTYSTIYQDSQVKYIERLPETLMTGYSSRSKVMDTFYRNWLGSTAYQQLVVNQENSIGVSAANEPTVVRSDMVNQITTWTTPKSISLSGWTLDTSQASSSSGRVNLKRSIGGMPLSPVFSIKLDAEWVGIYQPVTKPTIVSFKSEKTSYLEGDYNARFVSQVRNDGTVDGSINYELTCSPSTYVSISSTPTQTIAKGQTLTQYHNVQASTAGENVKASCCITVKDSSNPSIKAGPTCSDVTFVEQNQCPSGMVAGSTQCSSDNQIMQCVRNSDGILVLQGSGTTCQYGCAMTGLQATCMPKPGCNNLYLTGNSCGDGVCENFEKTGQDCNCLEDCTTCGDKFCSTSEKEGKLCPSDCGVPERCGDGICSQTEMNSGSCTQDCSGSTTNWFAIIGGSVLGIGVLGAIAWRLKKEGIFKW